MNRLFIPTESTVLPRITDLIAIVVVAFTVDPLRRFIEKATNKIFFKARYDTEEEIKNVSETISEVLDLSQLVNSLRLTLNRTLKVNKIAIYVKTDHHFAQIDDLGGFDKKFGLSLEKRYFLSKYFKHNHNLVITDELSRTIKEGRDSAHKDLAQILKFLKDNGVSVIIPLVVKDQMTGAIFLGKKLSEDIYSNEDIKLLEIFSHQASIALENARLYQEEKEFSEKLQQEVEKATTDLRSANESLKELDETKDEFVSVVSHELRTPMTAVKSYVWLALNGKAGPLNDKMRSYLEKVYQSSERLIDLINDVLDVSHIETGRINLDIQPISLLKVADDVVTTLAARADEQKIKLTLEKDTHVPMVLVDSMKLNEIFVNLIGNALKFTKPGGSITVSFAKKENVVETSVTDTGIGISQADLKKLFTKFGRIYKSYSTIAQSTGSGLGLYITKNYIDKMNGKIWVNSESGKGTTFTFAFPIAKDQKIKQPHVTKKHETISRHIGSEKS
ncbi:GAF domain-containing sensor histidine kinase [Patescibacteria group bacterium]|nr:GAF domain-containing sensor histidine kinase [Patescibacteria group bacterium]